GHDLTFERLTVHDNGQDDFQDESHGTGTLNNLVWRDCWIYNRRENPLYPGYSFNEPQSTGCTHADGIQIWGGGNQSGLDIETSVVGPLVNQGLYPSDGGIGTTYTSVTVKNTLFLATMSHNIITDNPVHGWVLDQITSYAPQGGSEVPSNGSN